MYLSWLESKFWLWSMFDGSSSPWEPSSREPGWVVINTMVHSNPTLMVCGLEAGVIGEPFPTLCYHSSERSWAMPSLEGAF